MYVYRLIMGLNKAGFHAQRLAQAEEIILKIKNDMHMQVSFYIEI